MRDHKLKQPLEVTETGGRQGRTLPFQHQQPTRAACTAALGAPQETGRPNLQHRTRASHEPAPWTGGFAESPESAVLTQRTDSHAKIPPPAGRLAEGWRPRVPAPPAPLPRGSQPRETEGGARALGTLRRAQVSARRLAAERVRRRWHAPRGCAGRTKGGRADAA